MKQSSAAKAGKPALWKSRNFLIGVGIGAVALAGGATFALWPVNRDAQVAAAVKQIEGKSRDEVRQIVDSGAIPREVAWEAMGAAREQEMQARLDAFFALKTQPERTKFLDQMINEMEARRKQWEARAATQPSGDRERRDRRPDGPTSQPSEDRRREMEQRRAARQDSTPPERRAQRVEFMAAMQKRMKERGIEQPAGGRGFGGFGGGRGGPPGGGGR
ncbi:MAG TPA: hypothetical protein PLD59_10190 [Tepidisphaeraceae bacterium]|nr:hypothetical protein [Tepidisphaeraceae bacterium]